VKQEAGGELLAHGGARFARSLIRTGLIDEYRLIVHPVILGNGLRIFPEPLRFELADATTFKTGAIAKLLRPASRVAPVEAELRKG